MAEVQGDGPLSPSLQHAVIKDHGALEAELAVEREAHAAMRTGVEEEVERLAAAVRYTRMVPSRPLRETGEVIEDIADRLSALLEGSDAD